MKSIRQVTTFQSWIFYFLSGVSKNPTSTSAMMRHFCKFNHFSTFPLRMEGIQLDQSLIGYLLISFSLKK